MYSLGVALNVVLDLTSLFDAVLHLPYTSRLALSVGLYVFLFTLSLCMNRAYV